jgi:3-oxoacyl-[acyl-carrier protein] reductase
MNLVDRTILVTGGGWNIGRAVAVRLAREGAKVAITSRRAEVLEETARMIRAAGGVCLPLVADLCDPSQAEPVVRRTENEFGPLFAALALAGGFGAGAPLDQVDPLDWWGTVERNLRTAFHLARAVLPGFRHRGGHLVFCSGGGAFEPELGSAATAYATAKAAVCRLTDQLQAEVWDLPIHVNCIGPGLVWHDAQRAAIEAEERRTGQPHPLRAIARDASETADLVVWLLTEAAGHMRGRLIATADGWWRDRELAAAIVPSDLYRLRRRT